VRFNPSKFVILLLILFLPLIVDKNTKHYFKLFFNLGTSHQVMKLFLNLNLL